LSTAVFRGSRLQYNFDVFPISPAITDSAAVFIFSKRLIDKKGRAHHAVSCLGETSSIASEIKKHKRARCVKGNEANVICILKEADKAARSGVIEDIRTNRNFSCIRGSYKPTIKATSDAKKPKTAKILPFMPAEKPAVSAVKPRGSAKPSGARKNGKKAAAVTALSSKKAKAKKGNAAASPKRVSRSVDSNGGQHRLSKPKKSPARGAKTRAAGHSRSGKKLAA
jgi:hypothetical protein